MVLHSDFHNPPTLESLCLFNTPSFQPQPSHDSSTLRIMHVDNKIQCAVAGCTESADTCFRRYPSVGQEVQSVVLVQPRLNFQVQV